MNAKYLKVITIIFFLIWVYFKLHIFLKIANIQENLEDQFVQEALNKGLDLRKYSKEVECDLASLEKTSIKDCNSF